MKDINLLRSILEAKGKGDEEGEEEKKGKHRSLKAAAIGAGITGAVIAGGHLQKKAIERRRAAKLPAGTRRIPIS
jgi:hypothetical protein